MAWNPKEKVQCGPDQLDGYVATEHDGRFVLLHVGKGSLPSMWNLFDRNTRTHYAIFGRGAEDAQCVADAKIRQVLG